MHLWSSKMKVNEMLKLELTPQERKLMMLYQDIKEAKSRVA